MKELIILLLVLLAAGNTANGAPLDVELGDDLRVVTVVPGVYYSAGTLTAPSLGGTSSPGTSGPALARVG